MHLRAHEKNNRRKLFDSKVLCGPMVRISTLGFRLLCAKYGADVVYSEEIIANKLRLCNRETRKLSSDEINSFNLACVSPNSHLIEYVTYDKRRSGENRSIVFSTFSSGEGVPVILQIGASSPEIALDAARLVENDVDGIELNMGCPKSFSTDQGMGAALMDHPENAAAILTGLVENLSIPVSVKTRLMPNIEESIALLRTLDRTGVHAITLHCRQRSHRYSTPADYAEFCRIRDALGDSLQASLVLNGDVSLNSPLEDIQKASHCDGFMICRSAMHNPSVFRRSWKGFGENSHETPQRQRGIEICGHFAPFIYANDTEVRQSLYELVDWHMRFGTCFQKIKYHVTRVLQEYPILSETYQQCIAAKDTFSIVDALQS